MTTWRQCIKQTSFNSFTLIISLHSFEDLTIVGDFSEHLKCFNYVTAVHSCICSSFMSVVSAYLFSHSPTDAFVCTCLLTISVKQVTWLVVTDVRSESFRLVTQRCHDIRVLRAISHSFSYWTSPVVWHCTGQQHFSLSLIHISEPTRPY